MKKIRSQMSDRENTAMFQRIAGIPCSCNGTGFVSVCLLCEEGKKHSHCDDSHQIPCHVCKGKKAPELKGGL